MFILLSVFPCELIDNKYQPKDFLVYGAPLLKFWSLSTNKFQILLKFRHPICFCHIPYLWSNVVLKRSFFADGEQSVQVVLSANVPAIEWLLWGKDENLSNNFDLHISARYAVHSAPPNPRVLNHLFCLFAARSPAFFPHFLQISWAEKSAVEIRR